MTDLAQRFLSLHCGNGLPDAESVGPRLGEVARVARLGGAGHHEQRFAATLGRLDGMVSRDEAIAHAAEIVEAVEVRRSRPTSENCFADDPAGAAETVEPRSRRRPGGAPGRGLQRQRDRHDLRRRALAAVLAAAAAEAAHLGERSPSRRRAPRTTFTAATTSPTR